MGRESSCRKKHRLSVGSIIKKKKVPECRNNRSHSDPTANEAIGNVMREERRKREREDVERTASTKAARI